MSGECGRGHSCVVVIAPRILVAFNFYPPRFLFFTIYILPSKEGSRIALYCQWGFSVTVSAEAPTNPPTTTTELCQFMEPIT